MANTSKLAGKFTSATKKFQKALTGAPWNLFRNTQIPYNDSTYSHAFRKGTMPTTVKLYPTILRAVEMYTRNGSLPYTDAPDYQMLSKPMSWKDATGNTVKGKEYFLELLWPDGTSTIMSKKGNDIRISDMETDGTNNPIGEFQTLDEYRMAGIYLLCIPEILQEDKLNAYGKLADKFAEFSINLADFAIWASETDIPDITKESAFFMDAIRCYAEDKALWRFADPSNTTATVAEQVSNTSFQGAVVVCSNPNVAFKYAVGNGKKDSGVTKAMTIGEAKKEFAAFASHRNWSAGELMMIPYFADNTPVMPETIRIARRILGTRDAVNPVCNIMWRGVTSFGKSTGVRQLACIFNMPLLILTCHPGMEITEFKSTFVPESEDDGIEVDVTAVALTGDTDTQMSPELKDAVQYVSQMEREERESFLSGKHFYIAAMMDTEGAAFSLFGKDVQMNSEDLCNVYSETICYFREKPLRLKIAHLETDDQTETPKQENRPGFKHVTSPYVKALVNGYIVEIQEPSRIRDSGVLVGLNEYDRAGAVLHLMNGGKARRHKDAICIMTDNVGYASCRPIDPSVLRRQGMIIDSYELPEQMVKDRVRRNTGCADTATLDRCYKLWNMVREYCETNSITEGSVSPMELERLVQAVMLDGEDSLEDNLADCVISKATSSIDDQRDIKSMLTTI